MTTPKQRKERLLQVCRVLRELPKGKKFDLGEWYKCGTVACALGWSASDPWFKRRGFRLGKPNSFDGEQLPAFKGIGGFVAASDFFGITYDRTVNFFDGVHYKRPHRRDVIRRIEKFVRDNPA